MQCPVHQMLLFTECNYSDFLSAIPDQIPPAYTAISGYFPI